VPIEVTYYFRSEPRNFFASDAKEQVVMSLLAICQHLFTSDEKKLQNFERKLKKIFSVLSEVIEEKAKMLGAKHVKVEIEKVVYQYYLRACLLGEKGYLGCFVFRLLGANLDYKDNPLTEDVKLYAYLY